MLACECQDGRGGCVDLRSSPMHASAPQRLHISMHAPQACTTSAPSAMTTSPTPTLPAQAGTLSCTSPRPSSAAPTPPPAPTAIRGPCPTPRAPWITSAPACKSNAWAGRLVLLLPPSAATPAGGPTSGLPSCTRAGSRVSACVRVPVVEVVAGGLGIGGWLLRARVGG